MPVLAILEIIKLSLEITKKLIEDMTPAQRAAFADRHEQRMAFWQKLVNRFDRTDTNPTEELKPNG